MIKSNLFQRSLSSLILAPIVLILIYYGSWPFLWLLFLIGFAILLEWIKMAKAYYKPRTRLYSQLAYLCFIVSMNSFAFYTNLIMANLLILLSLLSFYFLDRKNCLWLICGFLYSTLALEALYLIRHMPEGLFYLYWLIVIVWSTDIGAYFSGKTLGGPKLAPRLSPKKTWSGAIGGLLFALLASALMVIFTPHSPYSEKSLSFILLLAGLLSCASQIGDIVESSFKRYFGVKDSGNLIPGHGGILDRIDGLIFASIVFAIIILL